MADLKIVRKSDGKDYAVILTDKEQQTALSVMEKEGIDTVLVLKKHDGSALFFTNEQNCDNCMARHGFEFALTLEKKELQVKKTLEEKK